MLGREYSVYLNVINKSDNPLPTRATEGSSGFDLRANLSEPITLEPFQRSLIPTGLHFNLPKGFEIQIRPRSGLAAKHGVTVLNTPGTIDTDYTGEIKVILINLGSEPFTINHGDRIAQAVFGSNMIANHLGFKLVSDFDNQTERGENGFGSTGIKE